MSSSAQVVILAAGAGKRFAEAGYKDPKPLIPLLDGAPMIIHVVRDCVREFSPERVVIMCRADCEDRIVRALEREYPTGPAPDVRVVALEAVTGGAAETFLLATYHLDAKKPLWVVNSDQKFELAPHPVDFRQSMVGTVLVFNGTGSKWSYASRKTVGEDSLIQIVEKPPVPPEGSRATVGVYGFLTAGWAEDAVRQMIVADDRVNGEFYFAPCYNHYGYAKRRFTHTVNARMIPLGTPEDLERYLRTNGDCWL